VKEEVLARVERVSAPSRRDDLRWNMFAGGIGVDLGRCVVR